MQQKRNTQQRRHAIVTLLAERGELSVDWLAREFETSEVTIRKDLAELERNGLLLRRYGGAVPVPQELVAEAPEAEQVSKRKLAIARAAAELIRDHNRIIIDSGSTTAALIPELGKRRGLVVMTNSLAVAAALRELENEPTLLMTGGTWDPHSEAFQGQVAEQVLRSYDFDQLFIGAAGVDPLRGTTTFNELVGLSRRSGLNAPQITMTRGCGRSRYHRLCEWVRSGVLAGERSNSHLSFVDLSI